MTYDIQAAANELMLTTEDLKEIFDYYFDEAVECMKICAVANREQNYITIGKNIHAFKGSSLNLRITPIVTMIIELERLVKSEQEAAISNYLSTIAKEIALLKIEVSSFYHTTPTND